MYRINQNQEIIGLLVKLKEAEDEYPAELLAARRTSFLVLIARYIYGLIRL